MIFMVSFVGGKSPRAMNELKNFSCLFVTVLGPVLPFLQNDEE